MKVQYLFDDLNIIEISDNIGLILPKSACPAKSWVWFYGAIQIQSYASVTKTVRKGISVPSLFKVLRRSPLFKQLPPFRKEPNSPPEAFPSS